MKFFDKLGKTGSLLFSIGLVGVPVGTYFAYEKMNQVEEPVEAVASDESGDSFIMPGLGEDATSDEPLSKTEIYEESIREKEKEQLEKQEDQSTVIDELVEDEDFFSISGDEEKPEEKEQSLEDQYAEWKKRQEEENAAKKKLATQPKPKPARSAPKKQAVAQKEEPTKPARTFDFYTGGSSTSSSEGADMLAESTGTIKALVHNQQEVGNGSTLRVRLEEEVVVNGIEIPKNSIIWGNVRFGSDRVRVFFESIDMAGRIIPFKKKVYGKDGLEGIPLSEIPGADKLMQESKDDLLTSAERTGGLTGAIAGGAKTLSKKDSKIIFRDEYPFYIRD